MDVELPRNLLTAARHERLRLWLFARCMQESAEYPQLAAVAVAVAPK
jgi:hypothetical protein